MNSSDLGPRRRPLPTTATPIKDAETCWREYVERSVSFVCIRIDEIMKARAMDEVRRAAVETRLARLEERDAHPLLVADINPDPAAEIQALKHSAYWLSQDKKRIEQEAHRASKRADRLREVAILVGARLNRVMKTSAFPVSEISDLLRVILDAIRVDSQG